MSKAGYCFECGHALKKANILELHGRTGASLLRWRRGVARGVGGVLIQDLPPEARALL